MIQLLTKSINNGKLYNASRNRLRTIQWWKAFKDNLLITTSNSYFIFNRIIYIKTK